MSKTKMKVSGQFQNVKNAEYYAMMRSYLETGKRQGLNSKVLLEYAVKGEYYTLEDMVRYAKDHSIYDA